jgi:hypothetical protein
MPVVEGVFRYVIPADEKARIANPRQRGNGGID